MTALASQVAGYISRYSMLAPGTRLGVAVSGGADSVCLLHLLHALHRPLRVIHVNHRLRGAESDDDEAFVRELALKLGLAAAVFPVDVPREGNLEEAARDARREVFCGLIANGTVDRVALAHTRSDQAETVLFRLLRGAYTAGLAGMRPVTSDGLIRPLLEVNRRQIEDWLRERGLGWREDSSNADPAFARNRIRHGLLPQLEREWNPGLSEILANHAQLAQDDEDYWVGAVGGVVTGGNPAILDVPIFKKLLPALQRRVVRDRIRQVKGDLREIDFRHIEQVLEVAGGPDGHGRVQVPGVDVMRSFDWLRFVKPRPGPEERDWEVGLTVPGVFAIPGGESEMVLEVTDSGKAHDTLLVKGLDWPRLASESVDRLVLRNWRPGDRYRRAGHAHEEKVKQMFHEARVPLWERRDWPMVCVAEQVVWSRLFGPAAAWAATHDSTSVLRICERKRIDSPG